MKSPREATDIGSAVLGWLSKQDRVDLEHILQPAERVVFATGGTVFRQGQLSFGGWRIIVTSTRVLCVRGRGLMSRHLIEVPHSDVKTVDVKGRFFGSHVLIGTRQGNVRIGGMPNLAVRQLAAAIELAAEVSPIDGERPAPAPHRQLDRGMTRPDTIERVEHLEGTIDRLETQIATMQEQIDFLEELLTARGESGRIR